jgi:thiol:disulfide interchange protein DsbC
VWSDAAGLQQARQAISQALTSVHPEWQVMAVQPSVVDGLYEVQLQGGMLLYATADGRHVIDGDVYEIASGTLVSLTEQVRQRQRSERLAAVKREDMIIFSPPPPQATKAVLYVFTDVDCGYCQKFHQEVPQLNSMGIEVRYLAWPRAGFDSDTYRKMATIWCAKDRQTMLTRFKNRESVPIKVCENNPIAEQFLLGQELGVRGTPALVFANGELQPGYIPAARLVPMLLESAPR